MKRRLLFIFAAILTAAAVAAGCSDKNRYLRINPSSVEIESDAQAVLIDIECSSSWMAYNNADWLVYSYDNSNTLRITVSQANESLEPRESTITIVTGDGQEQEIYVLQKAVDAHFDVSPMQLEPFTGMGGQQTAVVSTNLSDWGVFNAESWLTATPGEGAESNTLTITASRSWILDERRDTLIVRPTNDVFVELADSIPVVQHGVDLIARWPDMPDGSFTINTAAEGGEISVTVYAKYDWTVTSDDTGGRLQFSMTSGVSDLNGITFVITIPDNASAEEFNYTLTFTCNGNEYEYWLRQPAAQPEPEPEPEP